MTTERHDTPPDLAATERALDRLGALDRAAAPASLESRAFEASRGALAPAARAPAVAVVARIGPARVRIAAAILLVGAIGGSLALRPGRSGPTGVSGPGGAAALAAPTDAALLERADEAVTLAFADASFSSLSGEIDAFSADPGAPLDSIDALDSLDDSSQEDSR